MDDFHEDDDDSIHCFNGSPIYRKPWCPTAQVPAPSTAYEAYDSVYELVEEEELEEPEVRNSQRFRAFWTQKTPFSRRFGLIFKLGKLFFPMLNGVCVATIPEVAESMMKPIFFLLVTQGESITNSWASWGFNRSPKTLRAKEIVAEGLVDGLSNSNYTHHLRVEQTITDRLTKIGVVGCPPKYGFLRGDPKIQRL